MESYRGCADTERSVFVWDTLRSEKNVSGLCMVNICVNVFKEVALVWKEGAKRAFIFLS